MYTFAHLIRDIKRDFKRYEEHRPSFYKYKWLCKAATLFRSPAFFAIVNFRYGFWINAAFNGKRSNPFVYVLKIIFYISRYLIIISTKIIISQKSTIGEGLFIANAGNCIIGVSSMGKNCSIDYSTTIGMGRDKLAPTIGDNVRIGSNSLVFGNITIGNNVLIDNNSIVSRNIPAGSRVKGNPGKIIRE